MKHDGIHLRTLSGSPWLEEFLKFLSGDFSKEDLIDALGTLRNSPEATLLTLKPFHPQIELIELFTKKDRIGEISILLKPEFGLTQLQLTKRFPDYKLMQNHYESTNDFTVNPGLPKLSQMLVTAPIGDDLSKPIQSLRIDLR